MSEPVNPPAAGAEDDRPAAVICEADRAQVDLPDEDAFDAALQVTGADLAGTEVIMWLRLTPTTITTLITQLDQVLQEQQRSLSIPAGTDPTHADPEPDPDEPAGPEDGRVRRFLDPMGIRHLKDRSPRTTVIMGVAIAALLLLAFLIQLVRG